VTGSMARILSGEGVCPNLIVTVGSGSDGGGGFFNSTAWARQRQADAMVAGLGELKLELLCMKRDDPTRYRRQGEPILQTYSEGNGRGRAGYGGAVQSMLGDGADGLQQCSVFEEQLYSFALLPSSSSLGQLLWTSMNRARVVAIFVR
jgi:hypothetical protein